MKTIGLFFTVMTGLLLLYRLFFLLFGAPTRSEELMATFMGIGLGSLAVMFLVAIAKNNEKS